MPPPAWAPDAPAVHALIPARSQDRPFDGTTVPTVSQVGEVIRQVTAEVVAEVGRFDPTVPLSGHDGTTLGDLARRAVALGAASQIEDSFFPEQQQGNYVGVDSTPSQHLYARYRRALELLRDIVARTSTDRGPFTGSVTTPLTTVVQRRRQLDVPYPYYP